ncbi:MAG: hypothetical protein IKN79_11505 [Eubacterium sp.]|nr:hypothetical protein [Eubacterium sp.]
MIKNRIYKKWIAFLMALAMIGLTLLPAGTAKADGDEVSVIMMLSKDTCCEGDTVTVTVSIKSKKAFHMKLLLSYPKDNLEFVGDEESDFKLEGTSLMRELRGDSFYLSADFRVLKMGSAYVRTYGNPIDEDGNQLDIGHAGANIEIVDRNGNNATSEDDSEETEATEDESTEDKSTEEVTEPEGDPVAEVDGKQMSFVTIGENYIPEGFKEGTAKYKGWTVPAYVSPNQVIKVVALQDEEENLYLSILSEGTDTLQAYAPVTPGLARYIIKEKPKNVDVPKGYKETTYDFGQGPVQAFKKEGQDDILLVYAINLDGTEGLFQYDTVDKSFFRYLETDEKKEPVTEEPATAAPVEQTVVREKDEGFFNRQNLIIISITLAALFLIMCILSIIFMAKSSKKQGTIEELEDRLYRLEKKQKKSRKETEDQYDDAYDDYPDDYQDDYRDDYKDDYEAEDYADEDVFSEGDPYEEEPRPLDNPVSGETIEIVMVDADDNNRSVPVPPAVDRKVDRVGEAMRHRPHGIDSAFDVVDDETERRKEPERMLTGKVDYSKRNPDEPPQRPDPKRMRREYPDDRPHPKIKPEPGRRVVLPYDDEEDEG